MVPINCQPEIIQKIYNNLNCDIIYSTMSGHSKWSTIKRKKEVNDQARGKLFSKLSKAISIAVKSGGGPNPDMNLKLKVAIDTARSANMPRENIDRAISRADMDAANLEEVTYEGFGPGGVGIIVEATTDNRNRTVQEIKQIFDRNGGSLATPNSVAYNFDVVGLITLSSSASGDDSTMLKLIDLGVEDIIADEKGLYVYTKMNELGSIRKQLEDAGLPVEDSHIVRRAKMNVSVDDNVGEKLTTLLEILEEHDDVQQIFTNAQ